MLRTCFLTRATFYSPHTLDLRTSGASKGRRTSVFCVQDLCSCPGHLRKIARLMAGRRGVPPQGVKPRVERCSERVSSPEPRSFRRTHSTYGRAAHRRGVGRVCFAPSNFVLARDTFAKPLVSWQAGEVCHPEQGVKPRVERCGERVSAPEPRSIRRTHSTYGRAAHRRGVGRACFASRTFALALTPSQNQTLKNWPMSPTWVSWCH